jgi:hypothetical protein
MRTLHRRLLTAALAFGLVAPLAFSIEPPPAAARPGDAELTRRVQQALAADPTLKQRSLVVSVVDGVAVVGGPVASAEESTRVDRLVRAVPDLADAKLSTWVPTIEDPVKKRIAEQLRGDAVRPPAGESRPVARVTVQRYEPPVPRVPLLADPLPAAAKVEPNRSDAAYSPLPAPLPAAPDGPPQYPTIPSPAVPVAPAQDVDAALAALRKEDARFADLTIQHRAGTVTVGGSADPDAAWDFIARVRKIPGVDKVLLGRMDAP